MSKDEKVALIDILANIEVLSSIRFQLGKAHEQIDDALRITEDGLYLRFDNLQGDLAVVVGRLFDVKDKAKALRLEISDQLLKDS